MSVHKTVPFPAPEQLPGPEASPDWAFSFPNTADFNFNYFQLLDSANDTAIATLDNVSVAVVGAGIAGLAAARELFRCGVTNIDIYEASDRIGGRDYSVATPGQDTIFEMGAMRMPFFTEPGSGACVLDYYRGLFDIQTKPFPDAHGTDVVDTGIWVNDGYGPDPANPLPEPTLLRWLATDPLPPTAMLEGIFNKWAAFSDFFTSTPGSPVATAYNEGGAVWQAMWQAIVTTYWSLSFRDLVYRPAIDTYDPDHPGDFGGLGMTAPEAEAFYTIGAGDGSWGAFYDVSCLYPIRTLLFGFAINHQLIKGVPAKWDTLPPGATDGQLLDSNGRALPAPLFRGVQSFSECLLYEPVTSPYVDAVSLFQATQESKYNVHLYTQTPVGALESNAGGVLVTADGTQRAYDAVIVTPSTWALQMSCELNFPTDMLPFETKNSIDSSHWISSTKVFYPLTQRYWEVSDIPQVINTDTFLQDVYGYAMNDDPGVLLLSYTWEDDANKLDAHDDDAALAAKCLSKLDEITTVGGGPPISQYVDTSKPLVFRWSRQPTYRGCAKLYRERSWAMDYALLTHNQQHGAASGLYFAGEGYSVEGGWTEPALRLALDAVIHLINDRDGAFLNGFEYGLYPQYDTDFQPTEAQLQLSSRTAA